LFERLAFFIHRHRVATLAASLLVLCLAAWQLARGGRLTGGAIHGLESERAQALADAVAGRRQDTTFVAVLRAQDPTMDVVAFRGAVRESLDGVRKDPAVLAVVGPDDPETFGMRTVNEGARAAYASITLAGDPNDALEAYPRVRPKLRSDRLAVDCTGAVPFLHDLGETLAHDLALAELVSLPLALLVLVWIFGSVVAAALPVVVGGLAVATGTSVVLALSRHMELAEYTINVCSLVGLGVGVDYSLFIVSRYREALSSGREPREALAHALGTAGRVVAFSGLAVAIGLSGLLFFRRSYLEAMGVGGAIVVAFAVVFALTALPALLAVLGPRIELGRVPLRRPAGSDGFWRRAAGRVMRHPLTVLVPTLALLLVLGAPFLGLRTTSADVRVLPEEAEAARAVHLLARYFPEAAANRIVVAVEFPTEPALAPARVAALGDFGRGLERLAGVTAVGSAFPALPELAGGAPSAAPPEPSPEEATALELARRRFVGGRTVLFDVLTDLPPDSEGAREIVRSIRAHRRVADGTVVVGGQTAEDLDTQAYIFARTPRAVAFVVAVTLVLLFVFFRSVLLPIKAVGMNFVSIAGSFGALVWIFQEGHLFVREPRPLEPSLPILLFSILFGLSMDYEVLMLSRMREAWLRTARNEEAVAEGLEKSAGLITSAAVIMIAVFSAFALARVVLIRAVGFGTAFAVLLDATVVRLLLVPSTMRLLGPLNWWAPRIVRKAPAVPLHGEDG
jgi:RND superfamily putative drug exporter